jgi:hypothetical protein
MGKLLVKFRKWFRKPWSSVYSTEVFSKRDFGTNGTWDMEGRSWWFIKDIGVSL